jgi:hypothetical protein
MALTSWGKSPIDVDHISSCFSRRKFLQETHNFSTCSMMILQKDGEIRVSYLSFEIRSLIVVVGTMASGSILLPIRVLLRLRGELILCVQDIGSYLSQVVLEILQHLQVPPHPGVVCTPPLIPRTGLPRCTQTQSDYYYYTTTTTLEPQKSKTGWPQSATFPYQLWPKNKTWKSKTDLQPDWETKLNPKFIGCMERGETSADRWTFYCQTESCSEWEEKGSINITTSDWKKLLITCKPHTHTHTHTKLARSLSLLLPTLHSANGKHVEGAGHVFFFFPLPRVVGQPFFFTGYEIAKSLY